MEPLSDVLMTLFRQFYSFSKNCTVRFGPAWHQNAYTTPYSTGVWHPSVQVPEPLVRYHSSRTVDFSCSFIQGLFSYFYESSSRCSDRLLLYEEKKKTHKKSQETLIQGFSHPYDTPFKKFGLSGLKLFGLVGLCALEEFQFLSPSGCFIPGAVTTRSHTAGT